MTVTAQLSNAQQRRLARLATAVGCAPQDLLGDVFKYGFDWVEADVRETLAGLADARSGKFVTDAEVRRRIERTIKAVSGRTQVQAA